MFTLQSASLNFLSRSLATVLLFLATVLLNLATFFSYPFRSFQHVLSWSEPKFWDWWAGVPNFILRLTCFNFTVSILASFTHRFADLSFNLSFATSSYSFANCSYLFTMFSCFLFKNYLILATVLLRLTSLLLILATSLKILATVLIFLASNLLLSTCLAHYRLWSANLIL